MVVMDTDSYIKKLIGNYLTKQATKNLLKTQHYNITEWSAKQLKRSETRNYFLKELQIV